MKRGSAQPLYWLQFVRTTSLKRDDQYGHQHGRQDCHFTCPAATGTNLALLRLQGFELYLDTCTTAQELSYYSEVIIDVPAAASYGKCSDPDSL